VLRVKDGIADLARHMAKVARVTLVGSSILSLIDEPHDGYGSECADEESGKETSSERLAVEATLRLDCRWTVRRLRSRRWLGCWGYRSSGGGGCW
jgi:hypothetical protein